MARNPLLYPSLVGLCVRTWQATGREVSAATGLLRGSRSVGLELRDQRQAPGLVCRPNQNRSSKVSFDGYRRHHKNRHSWSDAGGDMDRCGGSEVEVGGAVGVGFDGSGLSLPAHPYPARVAQPIPFGQQEAPEGARGPNQ
jgi:hypothetical protein